MRASLGSTSATTRRVPCPTPRQRAPGLPSAAGLLLLQPPIPPERLRSRDHQPTCAATVGRAGRAVAPRRCAERTSCFSRRSSAHADKAERSARRTPDAGRRTPDAGRRTPDVRAVWGVTVRLAEGTTRTSALWARHDDSSRRTVTCHPLHPRAGNRVQLSHSQ